ncbi:CDP-diacylglycerol--glycerol-3-phosphate 3-phosphatidyltransferase [Virgisporangium aliadipatigenens]|uniref:CDP-diacylglycerol--glycerol-3-phosphate 3-phosphatidyltransferase n=1 Tax=Virgisporangium aliadipatigenens TaxID=741659 RepID=A0A8J3YSK1_9ACTN|nr:CDP-alcohol phosphatidyltransferase family protein [Virgisporangium aliadipatigenens]GIJ49862.1 CDP-diacylglycerol--glycerol-3-phosphate 3-phosphatidyltransferase [Virgisporangium aliadipatigenens]
MSGPSADSGSRAVGWDEYAARWSGLHGGFDPRRASPLVRGWLRIAHRVACGLAALRVGPGAVTAFGVLLGGLVPVAAFAGGGAVLGAAALVVVGALADTVDGALAVVRDRVSARGTVYDSVADRLTEAAWLAAFWAVGAAGWPVVVCGAVAWLHEYVRARATVAGMPDIGTVTVAERPTRVLVALFGLAAAGGVAFVDAELAPVAAAVAVAVWTVLGAVGLVQLTITVRRAL